MHELFIVLISYIRGIWRYRWLVLGVAWVVCIIGWLVVAKLPDQYQASARVYVDTQSVLRPLLRGLAVQVNEQQNLLLMSKTLLSRPNLEEVMRMTDLDLQAKTKEEKEVILDSLASKIKLETTRRINLYTISYVDKNPELAKLVVKSLVTIFVSSNLGESRKEQSTATSFLENQIADYERRLTEAEERHRSFKQKNIAFLSDERGGYYSKLRDAQARLSQAKLELRIQQNRIAVLRQQIDDEENGPRFYTKPNDYSGSSVLDARISSSEEQLDGLLLRYTDKHPDIIGIQRTIDVLKKKREKELEDQLESGYGDQFNLGEDPVFQQLRMAYSEARADVAAKRAIVNEYQKQVDDLKSAVDNALAVEAKEVQLNRDYEVLKSSHSELMERLESSRITEDADNKASAVSFRIVDPPVVPSSPSGPNRELFSSGVLVAGLLFGVGIAFLLFQLRPTFDNRNVLNEITGLPVLGSVSMIWTSEQNRKRAFRHFGFLFGLLILVGMYGFVMSIYLYDIEIGNKQLLMDGFINLVRDLA